MMERGNNVIVCLCVLGWKSIKSKRLIRGTQVETTAKVFVGRKTKRRAERGRKECECSSDLILSLKKTFSIKTHQLNYYFTLKNLFLYFSWMFR